VPILLPSRLRCLPYSRIASNAFDSCLSVVLTIEGFYRLNRPTRNSSATYEYRNLRNLPCDGKVDQVAESLADPGFLSDESTNMQQFAEDSPSPPLRPRHHLPHLAPRSQVESSSSRERRTSSSGTSSTIRTPRLSHRSRAGCCMLRAFSKPRWMRIETNRRFRYV
jgi:hypothetical protein